jgi:hypothetical protein
LAKRAVGTEATSVRTMGLALSSPGFIPIYQCSHGCRSDGYVLTIPVPGSSIDPYLNEFLSYAKNFISVSYAGGSYKRKNPVIYHMSI